MKIILIKDVEKLGKVGDVLKVKDGYARNFLIPNGMAKVATSSNLKVIEEEKKRLFSIEENKKKEALEFAEKINNSSCTVSMRAGEDEKLFGAVTSEAIAKSCEAEGLKLEKRNIHIEQPIKKLGVYQVSVKVYTGVTASLKVWVVKE